MKQPVYLLDFSVYKPPDEYRVDIEASKANSRANWTVRLLRVLAAARADGGGGGVCVCWCVRLRRACASDRRRV